MRARMLGTLLGFGFGWAMLQFGVWRTLLYLGSCTLLGALVGGFIGRVLEGEVSLDELIARYSGRDRM